MRVYHASKDLWDATINEQVPCQSEHSNSVAVLQDMELMLGQVLQKIFCMVHLYESRQLDVCQVIESKRHSADLPLPVALKFCALCSSLKVLKSLLRLRNSLQTLFIQLLQITSKSHCLLNWPQFRTPMWWIPRCLSQQAVWVQLNDIVVRNSDRDIVINRERFCDLRINHAQGHLKVQFPNLSGLKPTLCQSKSSPRRKGVRNFQSSILEVVTGGLSNMCEKGQVKIYDSICNSLDPETVAVVVSHFKDPHIPFVCLW